MAGWASHSMPSTSGRSVYGHGRSLSSILRTASPKPSSHGLKPSSTSELPHISDLGLLHSSTPPKRMFSPHPLSDDDDMSTIPDPRSRAMSPANADDMPSPRHPDLDEEVATLSTKLINAINHQTTLDDNLSATRMELDNAHERIRQLEKQVEDQREMLAGDVWIKRKNYEAERSQILSRVVEEKRKRLDMEEQKKRIEQELENLTAALFEEANKMVITAKEEARQEQEVLHRKIDQLRAQIADSEGLLKSQQEQLTELKHVMEMMSAEKDEQALPTVPSSPGLSKLEALDLPSPHGLQPHLAEPVTPSYPTSFTHLLQPVLRTDLASYGDFKDLIRTSKRLSAQRVPPAQAQSGIASLGLGLGTIASQMPAPNGSNSSLSTVATPPATSPQTPNTPMSMTSVGSASSTVPLPHLKETKFYKRALTEDIDPTLRLDTAPGLSWLARRSVLTAMIEGTLVVEPIAAVSTGRFGKIIRPELYPCSLCGESRKDDEFLRTHRFRTSESGSAQSGYALCKYCLGRVQSTCNFLSFLRIVKDGHWRADDEDAEKAAWEESVRLREHMFWSRIGGGVVPLVHGHSNVSAAASPRPSHEVVDEVPRPAELAALPHESPKDVEEIRLELEEAKTEDATPVPFQPVDITPTPRTPPTTASYIQEPATPPTTNNRDSTQSLTPKPPPPTDGSDPKRLSVTIPHPTDP